MNISPKRPWRKSTVTLLTFAVLSMAFLLRFWRLGAESIWIDEAYSIQLSRLNLGEILRGTAADQHPPLYYLLLHFWLRIGTGVTHARLLSVIIGVAQIAITIRFGQRLIRPGTGILAGLLLAISPMHVWYSQEIRMYMLLATLTTASTYALWRCYQGKRLWWFYGILTALSIYTHYFAFFILLSHGCIAMVQWWQKKEADNLHIWLITVCFSLLPFTVWIPIAWRQFFGHSMTWIGHPTTAVIKDTILRMILGDGILLLPDWVSWIGFAIVWIALSIPLLLPNNNNAATKELSPLQWIGIWTLVPIGFIVLISLWVPIFQQKQLLICLTPMLFWLILSLSKIDRRWAYALFSVIPFITIISTGFQQIIPQKDDWRLVAGYLQNTLLSGDLIYGNPAAIQLALDIYLDEDNISYMGYPPDYSILSGGWEGLEVTKQLAEEEFNRVTEDHNRIWFIEYGPEIWDPSRELRRTFDDRSKLTTQLQFGKIYLRMYDLPDDNKE